MVINDKALQEEGAKIKLTLDDAAQRLAELVLRAYERKSETEGDLEDGKEAN